MLHHQTELMAPSGQDHLCMTRCCQQKVPGQSNNSITVASKCGIWLQLLPTLLIYCQMLAFWVVCSSINSFWYEIQHFYSKSTSIVNQIKCELETCLLDCLCGVAMPRFSSKIQWAEKSRYTYLGANPKERPICSPRNWCPFVLIHMVQDLRNGWNLASAKLRRPQRQWSSRSAGFLSFSVVGAAGN